MNDVISHNILINGTVESSEKYLFQVRVYLFLPRILAYFLDLVKTNESIVIAIPVLFITLFGTSINARESNMTFCERCLEYSKHCQ